MKRVLISGASIAGPTVGWWLARHGFDVTIVERSDGVRDGGQTVDIRGASKVVVERMGIVDDIVRNATHEEALAFVDESDEVIASFGANQYAGEGPVAELEILRGELAKLLVAKCEDSVRFRWNDHITDARDEGEKVAVTFASGSRENFDVLIVAEGIGSRTRNAIFGEEVTRRPFNLYTAYFTIPKGHGDGPIARWYNAPGGRGIFVRPDNLGTTRAVLNYISEPTGLEKREQAEQKRFMREKFSDLAWETPRVLDGMDASEDFYFEAIGQVRMARWSRGRIVVVGDAAYCASPLSGMGTALALCGAYVLAGELSRHADHEEAFAEYERIVRPYVDKAQDLPQSIAKLGQPKTRFGIALQRLVLKIGATPSMSWLTGKLFSPPADNIELPDYGGSVALDTRP